MKNYIVLFLLLVSVNINAQNYFKGLSMEEDKEIAQRVLSLMGDDLYLSAIDILEPMLLKKQLGHIGYFLLMNCYHKTGDDLKLTSSFKKWESQMSNDEINSEDSSYVKSIYSMYAFALYNLKEYRESNLAFEKSIGMDKEDNINAAMCYRHISTNYEKLELYPQAENYIDKSIKTFLALLHLDIDDIVKRDDLYDDNIFNNMLLSIVQKALLLIGKESYTDGFYYLALAASCGEETALYYFNKLDLDYHKYLKK
ncbi:MAG: hypothetical protein IKX24_11360 [Prevotella sp.]|nr:hypothetical protein [Prevotella sp.]